MSNFYKKLKLGFKGNFPKIMDQDEAKSDPYKPKNPFPYGRLFQKTW